MADIIEVKRVGRCALLLALGMAPVAIDSAASAQRAAPGATEVGRLSGGVETDDAAILTGTFVLAEPAAEADAEVEADIQEVVDDIFFLARGIATGRLRATNPVPRRLGLELRGDRIAVAFDDEARYEAREGEWIQVVARGETSRLMMQHTPRRLYLTFRGDQGQKRMVFTASEDGRHLWLDVDVTSPQMPTPLSYRIPYRRAE